MTAEYKAPWSRLLQAISFGATVLLVGIAFLLRGAVPLGGLQVLAFTGPLIVLFASLLFAVRGYEIAGGELHVRRPLWTTRILFDGLREVRHDPAALKGSLRLFGNGGLFSFSGLFRSKALGRYRAYLTDHARAVVLRWEGRTVVISPDRPEVFVETLARLRGLDR